MTKGLLNFHQVKEPLLDNEVMLEKVIRVYT